MDAGGDPYLIHPRHSIRVIGPKIKQIWIYNERKTPIPSTSSDQSYQYQNRLVFFYKPSTTFKPEEKCYYLVSTTSPSLSFGEAGLFDPSKGEVISRATDLIFFSKTCPAAPQTQDLIRLDKVKSEGGDGGSRINFSIWKSREKDGKQIFVKVEQANTIVVRNELYEAPFLTRLINSAEYNEDDLDSLVKSYLESLQGLHKELGARRIGLAGTEKTLGQAYLDLSALTTQELLERVTGLQNSIGAAGIEPSFNIEQALADPRLSGVEVPKHLKTLPILNFILRMKTALDYSSSDYSGKNLKLKEQELGQNNFKISRESPESSEKGQGCLKIQLDGLPPLPEKTSVKVNFPADQGLKAEDLSCSSTEADKETKTITTAGRCQVSNKGDRIEVQVDEMSTRNSEAPEIRIFPYRTTLTIPETIANNVDLEVLMSFEENTNKAPIAKKPVNSPLPDQTKPKSIHNEELIERLSYAIQVVKEGLQSIGNSGRTVLLGITSSGSSRTVVNGHNDETRARVSLNLTKSDRRNWGGYIQVDLPNQGELAGELLAEHNHWIDDESSCRVLPASTGSTCSRLPGTQPTRLKVDNLYEESESTITIVIDFLDQLEPGATYQFRYFLKNSSGEIIFNDTIPVTVAIPED